MSHTSSATDALNGANKAIDVEELRAKTNTQLLDELTVLMDMPPEDMDVERIMLCESILQERAPIAEQYDPDMEWKHLKDEHPQLFPEGETGPAPVTEGKEKQGSSKAHARNGLRIFRTFEIVLAAMLCLVITAEAFGYHPILAIFDWAEDILATKSPSGVMELPADTDCEYRSLREALDANGFEDADCPTWIPEDYSIYDVNVRQSDAITKIGSFYESKRGNLSVRITAFDDGDWSQFEEQEPGGYSYKSNGVEAFIFTNLDTLKVEWRSGEYSYVISGEVSENEIKRVFDSIR